MMRHPAWVLIILAAWTGAAVQGFADDVVTGVVREGAIDLSGTWRCKAVAQVEDSLFAAATDDSAWQRVQAPGRWADQKINAERAPAVVYRRTVKVPAEWQGRQVGISAWFCAGDSIVSVNGREVDPEGPPDALTADVSSLLRYGQDNFLAVSTTGDGIHELAESGPPLLGPLGQRHLTGVIRTDLNIPALPKPLAASLFLPEAGKQLPLIIFAATGHADYSIKDDWRQLNDDLARMGYASLAVVFSKFTPQEFQAVLQYAAALDGVDHSRIALVGAMKATRAVTLAAVAQPDVRTVVLVSSARIPEIAQLGERPVLFICGDKEASVPALSAAREMAGMLAGPHDIAALTSSAGGVALLDTSWNELREALLVWLGKYLRAQP
jgi:hypothetical protein